MLNFLRISCIDSQKGCIFFSGKKLLDQYLGARGHDAKQVHGAAFSNFILALTISMMFGLPAQAEISDTIHPFVAVSYSYDDNLLRLPDNGAGLNSPQSDTTKAVQAGLLLERPIGQQLLTGHANINKVTFDRFTTLDYTGKDFLGALNWHVAKHVDGNLGVSYVETLTPFTDFHLDQLNLLRERREYVDAAWLFHPSFRMHGGFTRDNFNYNLSSQVLNNRTEDASVFGIDFLASSASTVGVQLRHLKATYPNPFFSGAGFFDNSYEQNEAKANISWIVSGTSQVEFLGGWTRRKHASVSTNNNDNGTTFRLTGHWAPLGRVGFTAAAWRDFAAVASISAGNSSTSSLNKGASIAANWAASAKLSANAQFTREQRDFSATDNIVVPQDATDLTRSASAGLSYAALRNVQLNANVSHSSRSGDVFLGLSTYRSNAISFNATGQF